MICQLLALCCSLLKKRLLRPARRGRFKEKARVSDQLSAGRLQLKQGSAAPRRCRMTVWTGRNAYSLALMTLAYVCGEIAHFLINTTGREVRPHEGFSLTTST